MTGTWRQWVTGLAATFTVAAGTLAVVNQPEPGRVTAALAVGGLLGFVAGLRVKHRRYLTERAKREPLDQRMDAYRIADTRTDLDEVPRVAPERPNAVLFDQDETGAPNYDRWIG